MSEFKKSLNAAEKRWQKDTLDPALGQAPERHLPPVSAHVPPRERLYMPADLTAEQWLRQVGFPGEFPFTRGIHPTGYRSRHWTMRQYAGFGSAQESNQRYQYLLKQGQTGLSVAFDLPTQMGYDSDHAMAAGEVGRVGVAISSIDDMRTLLKDLPLADISTSMTINATAPILLAFYVAVAQERGVPLDQLRGTVQNDILKEYIARGTYIYPPQQSLRLITDLFSYCAANVPQWNTISVSGYHIREAGATATQEIAFTLADALTYVDAAKARGMNVEKIATRLSFFFNVHNDLLEEVAKFRAARRLWATLMKERFGVNDPRALLLRFHAQTAGVTLTAQQPYNNVVRVSLQALAAVLGGAQSLHTNSMDEALGLPTQEAATLALRTQQVIAYESGVTSSVDPLGGSYMIEELTDAIEKQARDYIERIDGMGGMIRAIEKGFPQREIQNAAYEYQQQIERKQRVIVGVNQFQETETTSVPVLKIDPVVEAEQVRRLGRFKQSRDVERVRKHLSALKAGAESDSALLPLFVEAVRDGVTLGEISETLRGVFGRYDEVQVV